MKFYTNVHFDDNWIYDVYYENGERKTNKERYKPSVYEHINNGDGKVDIYGKSLRKIKFDSYDDYRLYVRDKQKKMGENWTPIGDVRIITQYISEKYPHDIDFDINLIKIYYLDIEVASDKGFPDPSIADQEILSITIYDNKTEMYYVFGSKEIEKTLPDNVKYFHFTTEENLLGNFVMWFKDNSPDIVITWNGDDFDIPYIINRSENIIEKGFSNNLSPYEIVKCHTIKKTGEETWFICGVSLVDYMKLYKKYVYENQESYALGNIAKVELGAEKVNYQADYKNLNELYEKNYDLFIDYNMKDVQLLVDLEAKMKFIELHLTISYIAKIYFNDTYKTLQAWDALIYNYLKPKNIIVPAINKKKDDKGYSGAFVMQPINGFHKWVVCYDVNSLYPHLMMNCNISPDTLVKYSSDFNGIPDQRWVDKEIPKNKLGNEKHSFTVNGCYFKKDKYGIIPEIMDYLYQSRKQFQVDKRKFSDLYDKTGEEKYNHLKTKYHNMQYAFKILLNSGYGALGNKHFRFYDFHIAEAVTTMGRVLIKMVIKNVENKLNEDFGKGKYVIYSDTDSIYVTMDKLVEKRYGGHAEDTPGIKPVIDFINKSDGYMQGIIQGTFKEYCEYFNCYQNTFKMGREAINDKALFISKKKYIYNVVDDEGKVILDGKMKYKGVEVVRKNTPEKVRDKLIKSVKYIFDNPDDKNKLKRFVQDYYEDFKTLSIYDISKPTGINHIKKYTGSDGMYVRGAGGTGCPIHVRSAILYNYLVKKNKLQHKYRIITDKDKIRFVYLKVPNPLGENIIGYLNEDDLPAEFGLDKYIDYQTQFEKVYKKPILNIIECMGWDLDEIKSDLNDLF